MDEKTTLGQRPPFDGISRHGVYGRPWTRFARDLWRETSEDDVLNGAAAVGFYFTLAIFPGLIFLLGLLPFLPVENLQGTALAYLYEFLPGDTATMLRDTVLGVVAKKREGLLSLGAALTVWAASSGLYGLMQQLNKTYDVEETRPAWKSRAVALALVVGFGLLTTLALAVIVGGDALDGLLHRRLWWWTGPFSVAYQASRWLFTLFALCVAFSITYYFGPDVRQKFRFVTPGSLLAVLLLTGASLLFKLYVTSFGNYNATYGSIGTMIVLMLWLNILGVVTLLGSEVNALLEHYSPEGKSKGDHEAGEAA